MKRTLVLWTVVAALALAGCSKKDEGGEGGGNTGGGTGSGSGNLAVVAVVSPQLTYAELQDTLGQPIADAEVRINGVLLSPAGPGFYMTNSVTYAKGETYTLSINAEGYGSAEATVTAPNIDSLKITAPNDGAQLEPNTAIQVNWSYYGGENNGLVGLSLDYTSPTDTTTYESGILDGATTSHTIPAEATALEGEASISVSAGDFAVIEGLPDPDPTDDFEGSIFGVVTYDDVSVTIGSGGGGAEGQWMGTLSGTMDNSAAGGYWTYPVVGNPLANVGFMVATDQDTVYLGGNTDTWPPQNLNLISEDFQTTMTISGELVGSDSVAGTWEMSGVHNGSGTWGGHRVAR